MNELEISNIINEVKELSERLHHSLELYKEATRDPEATLSIPNIDNMCLLAEELYKKLDKLTNS